MARYSILTIVAGLIAICATAENYAANQKEAPSNDFKAMATELDALIEAFEKDGEKEKSSADVGAQIKELQTNRGKALALVAEVLSQRYKAGIGGMPVETPEFGPLGLAKTAWLNAKLDVTDRPAERVKLLTDNRTEAIDYVKRARACYLAGTIEESAFARVVAYWLDARIKLLKESLNPKLPRSND